MGRKPKHTEEKHEGYVGQTVGKTKPIVTKIPDARYRILMHYQKKYGFASTYEFVGAIIGLTLLYMDVFPEFHNGRRPETFKDFSDMFEMFMKNRVGK